MAELRRRFALDDPDEMTRIERDGDAAWIGLPRREGIKLQELWYRGDLGLELSVEVHAPVVVGIYPMRIARYLADHVTNGHANRADILNREGHGTFSRFADGQDNLILAAGAENKNPPPLNRISAQSFRSR